MNFHCRSVVVAAVLLITPVGLRAAEPLLIDWTPMGGWSFHTQQYNYNNPSPGWSARPETLWADELNWPGVVRVYTPGGRTGNAAVTLHFLGKISVWPYITVPTLEQNFGGFDSATIRSTMEVSPGTDDPNARRLFRHDFGGPAIDGWYTTEFTITFPVPLGVDYPVGVWIGIPGAVPYGAYPINPDLPAAFGLLTDSTVTVTDVSAILGVPDTPATLCLLLCGLGLLGAARRGLRLHGR